VVLFLGQEMYPANQLIHNVSAAAGIVMEIDPGEAQKLV
jgi:hypothetical protein